MRYNIIGDTDCPVVEISLGRNQVIPITNNKHYKEFFQHFKKELFIFFLIFPLKLRLFFLVY